MKVQNSVKPEKRFSIEKVENGKCAVLFFDNIQEEIVDVPTLEDEPTSQNKIYTYDVYTAEVDYRENLAEEIEANIEKWLKFVKDKDYEKAAAEVRAVRNKLLEDTDAEMCLDRMGLEMPEGTSFTSWINFLKTLATAITGKMAKYRQALRDITKQEGFPYNVVWPTKDDKED